MPETVEKTGLFGPQLTTMVAFISLVVSGLQPVIDFGWMMTTGIAVALVMDDYSDTHPNSKDLVDYASRGGRVRVPTTTSTPLRRASS